MVQCSTQPLLFEGHGRREVTTAFDGGRITTDAGAFLLCEVKPTLGIIRQFALGFTDFREPSAEKTSATKRHRYRHKTGFDGKGRNAKCL
ncbi:MAG: transposase [Planctomycetaceae bacterium]|nr:transposase [Planctomycetaceae bacterium]